MYRDLRPAARPLGRRCRGRGGVWCGARAIARFAPAATCAAIYDARAEPAGAGDYKADFFREEYWLIERVHRLPKPYVALVDGIAMGGGCGVSINGSHRVVTERTRLRHAEVHIGSSPTSARAASSISARANRPLSRADRYARFGAADALYCGFATHYVPHDRLAALTDALARLDGVGDRRAAVDAAIARFRRRCSASRRSRALRGEIDRCFCRRLGRGDRGGARGARRRLGAEAALSAIERASPLSLKITFRQFQIGARHGHRGGAGARVSVDPACDGGPRLLRRHPRACSSRRTMRRAGSMPRCER